MDSFDQSLKYLLQHEPADFIRFGLRDPTVQILRPVESGLPSRGRDVDGGYAILRGGEAGVAHVEFHRRHESEEDLAVDVAEAQVRLFRRERVKVVSLVWDLYGDAGEPMVSEEALRYGASLARPGSEAVYVRVNLRALGFRELLTHGPPALWPLVALTRDGAGEQGEAAVHEARDAIGARTDLGAAERADHLAVLWFVAEAEKVPVRVMREYISETELMASTLYQSIFEKGEARGEARGRTEGEARARAETIIQFLTGWMGALDAPLRERIRAVSDLDTLRSWLSEAVLVRDAEGAERLAEKIRKAPLA
jgi:hypothetical protein